MGNSSFIKHCEENDHEQKVIWAVGDATVLRFWATENHPGLTGLNPLIACVNNTLSIMPPEIRPKVVRQMRKVAGPKGLVFLSYWNGMKFREGLIHYYKKNPQLCGNFEIYAQDFDRRKLHTDTGYTSYWPLENEVELMVISYGVRPEHIVDIKVVGKGIFAIVQGIDDSNGNSPPA